MLIREDIREIFPQEREPGKYSRLGRASLLFLKTFSIYKKIETLVMMNRLTVEVENQRPF